MAHDDHMLEDSGPQVMQVRIINRNSFPLTDMFDGTPYTFEPNVPLAIPVDAAHHIFGWFAPYEDQHGNKHEPDPTEMRRHTMRRFGWNTPAMAEVGDIYYSHIKLSPITYRMVPVPIDGDDDEIPPAKPIEPPKKQGKLMRAADEAAARHAG